MRARFLGRISAVGFSATVERTDGGHASGPHTLSLPDGEYYLIGQGIGVVSGASSGTTITMAAGHPFAVGDRVSVYDVSGSAYLLDSSEINSISATSIRISDSVSVAIGDLVCAAPDLLGQLEMLSYAADPTELAGILSWDLTSEGVAEVSTSSAVATVFVNPDADIDAILYTTSATVSLGSPLSGTREARYAWYPGYTAQDELPRWLPQRSQTVSDSGRVETHHYSTRERVEIRQLHSGSPWGSSYDEWTALESWWTDVVAPGRPVRWYRDSSELDPYAAVSEPSGYRVGTIVSPTIREPRPKSPGYYGLWEETWVLEIFSPAVTEEGPGA